MTWLMPTWVLMMGLPTMAQSIAPMIMLDPKTQPAKIKSSELAEFESLSEARKKLIEAALAVAWESSWLPYVAGGASPEDGGFDCSGAMYFIMRKVGLKPPRSSSTQMEWLRENGRLQMVPAEAKDLKHASFAALKPGDLLFWAVYTTDGSPRVHHVAMYLGTEKKDARPVMIDSTDGRSYRGQKTNGYGVHDLRVPKEDSKSKLIAYGTPPDIAVD